MSRRFKMGRQHTTCEVGRCCKTARTLDEQPGRPAAHRQNYAVEKVTIGNKDAVVAICLGYPAFKRKRIGLKKIPPPIPTNPEKKPIIDPIRIEKIFGIVFILNFLFLKDLLSINNNIPAIAKIKNNNISNRFFEICNDAAKNAKGIEPIR